VSFRELFRQERRAHVEFLLGTVVTRPKIVQFDGVGPVWVVDVDVGGKRLFKNVPVKAVAQGGRFYADINQPVLLKRNAQGRFDVVGSADRKAGVAVVKGYDLTTGNLQSTSSAGFSVIPRAFEHYMGEVRLKGNPLITFDRVPAANDTITRSAGSWSTDGFLVGHLIRVGNTTLNNFLLSSLTILTLSATVLGFAGDVLQDEGPISNVLLARAGFVRWNDGVTPFPKVSIVNQSTGLEV
jgi:hypothetical protein